MLNVPGQNPSSSTMNEEVCEQAASSSSTMIENLSEQAASSYVTLTTLSIKPSSSKSLAENPCPIIDQDEYVSDSDSDDEPEETWSDFLTEWAVTHQIKKDALNALLKGMLKKDVKSIPLDARTLLATPKHVDIKKIAGGQYWHRGLERGILDDLKNIKIIPGAIELQINIYGLPISKSSSGQFYISENKYKKQQTIRNWHFLRPQKARELQCIFKRVRRRGKYVKR